ncbi:kinase-like domain-containing protein [Melanogaster broomeanus]|nr:kinase-like domain-containing protein [Melanogaster broomeanus]
MRPAFEHLARESHQVSDDATYSFLLIDWSNHASESQPQHCVAVKILSAHATEVQGQLANELPFLKLINEASKSSGHADRSHVVTLLDDFQLMSIHGSHICLVYEAAGSFSTIFKGNNKQLPVNQVKNLARQLLLALDFLHRECHIVHTDIKPDNMLIKLNDADKVLVQEIEDSLPMESPSKGDAPLAVLSHPISPFNLVENSDTAEIPELNIELTDFGTAADVTGLHVDIIQPYALRAPEVILGCGWDTSTDIWNLGSLIFEFLTGCWLFVPQGGPHWTPEAYHLINMRAVSGDEFNMSFTQKGERFDQYFKDDGNV